VLLNDINNPQIEALTVGLSILKHADYRNNSHNVPQHWILAGRDRLIPPAVINDLKTLRPDDQITLLEDTGHALFMTHPQIFMASLIPFIENNA
jgi:pimeloyl-[acyl-carrier protein] methyl ester esterase